MIFTSESSPMEASLIENPNPSETELELVPESRLKRYFKVTQWVIYTVVCLIVFTVIKLPEDRIKNYINGSIAAALAPKGISFTSTESKLSFLFGISYTLKGIVVNFPPPAPSTRIEKIEISPSILPLLIGRTGGTLEITEGTGSLTSSFSIKKSQVSLSFKAKKLDLGKLGILPVFAGIQASTLFDGNGSLSGDLDHPNTLDGNVLINLSKIVIEPQSLMGFSIPRISVSEGLVDVTFNQSKATIKNCYLGKPGNTPGNTTDDIYGTVSGAMTATNDWNTSILNLKLKFSFSEGMMKSFVLLDALLSAGKQPDGSYAFSLAGPFNSLFPTPILPGS